MPIYKTDKKKDGIQQYRVVVNYTRNDGTYHKKTKCVYGLGEAKQTELFLLHNAQDNQSTSKMTVSELFEEYKKCKVQEIRKSSLEKTNTTITTHILPFFERTRIDKLSTSTLIKWKDEIGKKDFTIRSKQNIFTIFSSLLNYAVKMDYLSKNPLKKIGNFKEIYFEKPQEKLHFYTPKQFKEFINTAKQEAEEKNDWRYYVFFNIAYFTGARKGEINALKWSDLEKNTIHIHRSITQKIKGEELETPPKNKSSFRDIQLPKNLLAILQEHKARQKSFPQFTENFRICGGEKTLRDTSIENKNKKYAQTANLPHIRIHDYRHSHASLLANNGINIQEIAKRLGHSKIEMTWNIYSHLYPKEEERALKVLENIDFQ